jgi:hypothetical protein
MLMWALLNQTKGGDSCKLKLMNLKSQSKNKNVTNLYKGSSDFKKGYHPKTNIVKDEKG